MLATHGTACRTCRRRRRKCDKALPTCQSCKNRGVLCEGYVTRWPGVAARGKLAGQSIPVISSVPQPSTPQAKSLVSPAKSSTALAQRARGWTHSLIANELPLQLADGLSGFIKYYAQELGSVFYFGPSTAQSPYLLYVLPLAERVMPLRYAIASAACCHLASRFHIDALETQSRRLQLKAIEFLRARVSAGNLSRDIGVLVSILMMTQLDICSGDCISFRTHLPAAKALLDSFASRLEDRGFFAQRLAWMDIIRATTSPRLPTFTSSDIKKAINKYSTSQGREWGCEVFPCPVDLFECITDITMLYHLQPDDRISAPDVIAKATALGRRVSEWSSTVSRSENTTHVANAWQAGIVLYVIRLFQLPRDDTFDVEALRRIVFTHTKSVPTASSWWYFMVWPLFQAGLWLEEEDCEEDREWLRDQINIMTKTAGCRQFGVARETLDIVWASDEYYNSITAGALKGSLFMG